MFWNERHKQEFEIAKNKIQEFAERFEILNRKLHNMEATSNLTHELIQGMMKGTLDQKLDINKLIDDKLIDIMARFFLQNTLKPEVKLPKEEKPKEEKPKEEKLPKEEKEESSEVTTSNLVAILKNLEKEIKEFKNERQNLSHAVSYVQSRISKIEESQAKINEMNDCMKRWIDMYKKETKDN